MRIERETLWTRRGLIAGGTSAGALALALGGCQKPLSFALLYEMTTVLEVEGQRMSESSVVEDGYYDSCPSNSHTAIKTFCRWGPTYKGVAPFFDLGARGYLIVPMGVNYLGLFRASSYQQLIKSPPDLSRPVPVPLKILLHITREALADIKLAKLHFVAPNTAIMPGVIYRSTEIASPTKPLIRQYPEKPEWLELMKGYLVQRQGHIYPEKSTLVPGLNPNNSIEIRSVQLEG